MNRFIRLMLCLCSSTLAICQAPTFDLDKEFPLVLEIAASQKINLAEDHPTQLAQANAMGSAPPIFAVFKGSLSSSAIAAERENHWSLGCWAENPKYEQDICEDMPIGLHRARWVHNRELLEVLAYDKQGAATLRYIDVTVKPNDPPNAGDAVQNSPIFTGFYNSSEQTRRDYPELVHVYGAVSLSLPAGQIPGRTSCDITERQLNFSPSINVTCRQFDPIQLSRGYVVIDAGINGNRHVNISCDAKWTWTKCAAIGPGLYEARWTDATHTKITLLGRRKGKPEDIGFEVRYSK